jgi:hypothetical protein
LLLPLPLYAPTTALAFYGFGDASGSSFGTMLLIGDDLHYQYKQWTTPFGEQSSNYRELSNLVLGIEGAFHSGPLENWEVFFFTDNTTAEAAFHKGTSYSKPLFDLILRLQTLQMHHGLFLHAIHVAGT